MDDESQATSQRKVWQEEVSETRHSFNTSEVMWYGIREVI